MKINEEKLKKIIRKAIVKEMKLAQLGRAKQYLSGVISGRKSQGDSLEDDLDSVLDELETGLLNIEGGIFTIKAGDNILTFQSVPYARGAAKSIVMHQELGGRTDKGTDEDKQAIIDLVYREADVPGYNSEDKLQDLKNRLGTVDESFWSSWFFTAVYKEDSDYPSRDSMSYPSRRGYRKREKVLANPKRYEGKTFYMIFKREEAPIFPGDAIFHWRGIASGNSFYQIGSPPPNPLYKQKFKADGVTKNKGESFSRDKLSAAHMRVYVGGGQFIGGNEGGGTIKKSSMKVSGDGILAPGQGRPPYMAVFKKVKLLSPEEALLADPNISSILDPENTLSQKYQSEKEKEEPSRLETSEAENLISKEFYSDEGVVVEYQGMHDEEGVEYGRYVFNPGRNDEEVFYFYEESFQKYTTYNESFIEDTPIIDLSNHSFLNWVSSTYSLDHKDINLFI